MKNKKLNVLCAMLVLVAVLAIPTTIKMNQVPEEVTSVSEDKDKIAQSSSEEKKAEEIIKSTKVSELPDGTENMIFTGMLIGYENEELIENSSLLVYGEIIEISEVFKVVAPDGYSGNMTDITVRINETYRGESDENITVRLEGGLVGDIYEDFIDYPEFRLGEEWMFFLNQPTSGGGLNTLGDYYYLVGVSGGAFRVVDEDIDIDTSDGDVLFASSTVKDNLIGERVILIEDEQMLSQENGEAIEIFSDEAMKEYMPIMNEKYPAENANDTKEDRIAVYKQNYENDFITYEAYLELVESLDQYAEIVYEE